MTEPTTIPTFFDEDYCAYCAECGHSDCMCEIEACRVCGGSGHIYDEDDPETGWECWECGGTGNAPL